MATNPNWLVQPIDLASLAFAFDGPTYTEIVEDTLGPDVNAPDGMDENFNDMSDLADSFQQDFDGSTFDLSDMNDAAPAVDVTDVEDIQASIEANFQTSEGIISDMTAMIPADPTPVQIPIVPPIVPPGIGPGGGGGGGDPRECFEGTCCPPGFIYVPDPDFGPGSCQPDFDD